MMEDEYHNAEFVAGLLMYCRMSDPLKFVNEVEEGLSHSESDPKCVTARISAGSRDYEPECINDALVERLRSSSNRYIYSEIRSDIWHMETMLEHHKDVPFFITFKIHDNMDYSTEYSYRYDWPDNSLESAYTYLQDALLHTKHLDIYSALTDTLDTMDRLTKHQEVVITFKINSSNPSLWNCEVNIADPGVISYE